MKLIDCIEIKGRVPTKFDGKKSYISTGALYINKIDDSAIELVSYDDRPSRANLMSDPGDILFAKMANTKKTIVLDDDTSKNIYSTGFFSVAPREKIVTTECLFYILNSDIFLTQKNKYSSGATMKSITNKGLASIEIKLPDYETKKKIGRRLKILEKSIDVRREQLQKLDDLIKAQFVEMFGEIDLSPQKDTWVQISKIGDVVGGSTPKTNIAEYWNGDLRWLTPAEIVSGSGYIYDSKRKITKAGVDSCSLQELPRDTVILSSRAPIGKVTIAGTTFYCNQGFKNIICSDKILPVYLYSLLLYNTDYLNSLGRGATFKEISKKVVEQIRIPVPSIALQSGFATFVSQVDKSKFAISCDILSMRNFYIRLINNCVVHRSVDL